MRVLVVDDDEAIRTIASMALERVGGMRVTAVASGEEALATITGPAGPALDVVLLDVMMPGLDGPATLARLRATVPGAELPVVFLTAKLQPEERRRLEGLPVAGVLPKPFDPMTLASSVQALVVGRTP